MLSENRDQLTDLCILIGSSANTSDVRVAVVTQYSQSLLSCGLPVFVGTNPCDPVKDFHHVTSENYGWKVELQKQVGEVCSSFEYIFFFLDDFMFGRFPTSQFFLDCLILMEHQNIDVLSFEKFRPSLFSINFLKQICPMRRNWFKRSRLDPYFSSLQPAIWRSCYLNETLKSYDGSIWGFEHVDIGGNHVVLKNSGLRFEHLVEKGAWKKRGVMKYGIRPDFDVRHCTDDPHGLTEWWVSVRFAFFGYLRHWLRQICSR